MAFYRSYDPSIAKWTGVDPEAEMYYSWNSYNMALGNPITNRDPSGATVTPTQSAFDQLNIGLSATLGENHGFSLNGEGQLNYEAPEGVEYNETQKDIIKRMKTLITAEADIRVDVISKDKEIKLSDGNTFTLREAGINGVTIAEINPETQQLATDQIVQVYLADKPLMGKDYMAHEYTNGTNALHELGGHTYLRLSRTELNIASGQTKHNKLVENFETRIRQIYKIGVWKNKSVMKRYNADIRKRNRTRKMNGLPMLPEAKIGDDKTLIGSKADKHVSVKTK